MPEYRNPQQEPGADKRLIVSMAVLFISLLLMQQLFHKKGAEQAEQQKAAQPTATQQQAATPAPSTPAPQVSATAAPSSSAAQAVAAKKAEAEEDTVVENDVYRITFTNRGGQVKSWILKQHKDDAGKPLDLVHAASAQYGYPLSLWTWDQSLRDRLNSSLYVKTAEGNGTSLKTLTFEYAEGDLVVKKTFGFDDSYVVKVQTSVQRNGSYVSALPAWPSGLGDMTHPASYTNQHIDYFNGSDVKRLKLDRKGKDISGGRLLTETMDWVGTSDQYFAAIFMPQNPQTASVVELRNGLQVPKDPAKPNGDKVPVDLVGTAVGTLNAPVNEELFVGPKSVDVLKAVKTPTGGNLEAVQDFGFWTFIAKPLFAWARWTEQKFIPNWGWTIIFLTIIINVVLLPLRLTSMRSALKMQKIAPQVKVIQEKYKQYKLNDPRRQEMTTEINKLYSEHGVNPAAGCLPLIIQMPFLFAFYGMLANAFELRQAHFLWLPDLAAPDRWFILPALIIISMFVMQRMTPNTGMSQEQQRMMNFMMPIIFGSMSYSLASGLGLYWVTGTIVSIVQQFFMNRSHLGQEMRALAEKRARKQQGKGKK
ncbi:MAG TPA: membrane protein insertase YidC [Terriglobales bacterium]